MTSFDKLVPSRPEMDVKNQFGYHKTQNTMLCSNPLKKCKKLTQKSYLKTFAHRNKSQNFSVTFLLITFFAEVFCNLNLHTVKFCILEKLVFTILALFANFEVKRGRNSSKKRKKHSNQRPGTTKLLKLMYPTEHVTQVEFHNSD